MIKDLFPTALGLYDYKKPMSQKELEFIENLKYDSNNGNSISADKTLLDFPEMKKLRFFFKSRDARYRSLARVV